CRFSQSQQILLGEQLLSRGQYDDLAYGIEQSVMPLFCVTERPRSGRSGIVTNAKLNGRGYRSAMYTTVAEALIAEFGGNRRAGAGARLFKSALELLVGLSRVIAGVPGTVFMENLLAIFAAGGD